MRLRHLPLATPRPDVEQFIDTLMGRTSGVRPPLVEYLVDPALRKPIITDLLGRQWVEHAGDRESQAAQLDNFIEFWYRLGYDFVRYEEGLGFARKSVHAPDTAPGSAKDRAWADEHHGTIEDWEDFESYTWPTIEAMDFSRYEYLNNHLPEGMGLIVCHAAGVFEHLSQIMSLEKLSFALYDCPELVKAITDRLGELMTGFYEHLLDLDRVVMLFPGDDMGFRTSTLVAPDVLRAYVLPWHKRFAAMAHEKGLPYFLHSCGNLEAIMDDLISDVGIDGKHSFEDAILPAESFQERYGDRIAVLGGVDLNVLAGSSPEEVRKRTRELKHVCGERGRYAVGSGNSVPSYVPLANYLAMVDEALDG